MASWLRDFFSFLDRVPSERLLLKQCLEEVADAQRRFADLSYSREIELAIRRVLDGHVRGLRFQLPEDEILSMVATCVFLCFEYWEHLPTWRHNLRVSVRQLATAYGKRYLRAKLSA
jgi:hypothetical protein